MHGDRILPFEGAINFRDLGGYRAGADRHTRWRRVYRSDSLAGLTEADLKRLDALGLYGLCDFRTPDEVAQSPDRLPSGHCIRLTNPGFLPANTTDMLAEVAAGTITPDRIVSEVTGHYRHFGRHHVANYAPLFRLILEADGRPVLFHCTSGKDRTGWGAALLLLAAGCDEATVIADYVLTNDLRRDIAFMFPHGVRPELIATLTSALPTYIKAALAELDHAGFLDGDGWQAELGLGTQEIRHLRHLLTERRPAA